MRATRATRALAALYEARPNAALSEPEVEAALASAGVAVNKVTVYRMLDRFAAAGLLHKHVDAARVTRYALAPRSPAISASQVDLPVPERPRSNSVPPWRKSTSGKRSGAAPPVA